MSLISENIQSVEERIRAACARAGRSRDEVTLICVTKTMPVEDLRQAYDAGQRSFGEKRTGGRRHDCRGMDLIRKD